MKTASTVEIMPIFSLRPFIGYLSPSVVTYYEAIELMLSEQERMHTASRVDLVKLPGKLRTLSGESTLTMKEALYEFTKADIVPSPDPFMLGLFDERGQSLKHDIGDALRIECFTDECFFLGKFNRKCKLCLRRSPEGIIIDISEYLQENVVNAAKRYSGTSIRTIIFTPEKTPDLSEKMIG